MNPLKLTEAQIDGLRNCRHRLRTGRHPGAPKGAGSRLAMMRKLKKMGLIYLFASYGQRDGKWYLKPAGLLILDLLNCP